jgi:hypothetical protein
MKLTNMIMKNEVVEAASKLAILRFFGYNDVDDLNDKIKIFVEGYQFAMQQINNNDCIADVSRIFTLDEVQNIALELKNAAQYAHSHKLTRFQLQDEIGKVYDKYKLWSC